MILKQKKQNINKGAIQPREKLSCPVPNEKLTSILNDSKKNKEFIFKDLANGYGEVIRIK